MIDCEVRQGESGGTTLVLLHGRGSEPADMLRLAARLPEEWTVVAPRAPFPAAPWGYGPGWAWYEFLGRNRPEAESFSASLRALDEFLPALPGRLGAVPGLVVLGGFSQGGVLSLAYAISRPGAVPAVLNFSGFLADHSEVRPEPDRLTGTAVFWGHGLRDGNIAHELAVEGRGVVQAAGAALEVRDYSMGHTITAGELDDAVVWVRSLEAARRGSSAPSS